MDLEKELRQAMAEHVAEAAAPSSLVTDVRRRHRRRVTRIRTTIGVAAAAVAAIAALPAAEFFDIGAAAPVGAPTTTIAPRPATSPPGSHAPLAPGSLDPRLASKAPRAGSTGKPSATPPHSSVGSPGGITGPVDDWLTYLPSGLQPAGPCLDERSATRRTTTCRWTGTGGTLEVQVVRGSGLTSLEDFSAIPPMPRYTSVHGRRAITGERMLAGGAGGQVMWIERPGTGMFVSVSTPLRSQLMRIAEGVNALS
jgi:hypothetical protein